MNRHQTPLRAIFFDYGGTLDSQGAAWKEHFWPIYEKHGVNVDYQRFVRAFYRSDDSLIEEGRPDLTLSDIVHEQVRRVLIHLDLQDAGLVEKIAGDFLRSSTDSIKRAMPVLARLKKSFRLGIISNNYGNLEAICRETGLDSVMDVLVDSRVIGAVKPEKKIFETALGALDLRPHEAMMVGDSLPRDVLGALSMGMRPVWLVPAGEKTKALAERPSPDVQVITGLDEIPALPAVECS